MPLTFNLETLLLLPFSHMSSGTWSHSRSKPGLGLSAKYCLCGKFSAPWIPWVRADSYLCTGIDQSGISNRKSRSNSQPLQPIVNHFIKNIVWKTALVKQEIKLRQIIHLGKCHQFKSPYHYTHYSVFLGFKWISSWTRHTVKSFLLQLNTFIAPEFREILIFSDYFQKRDLALAS